MPKKLIKISFFGASVTHQKNGYVDKFAELDKNKRFVVRKHGFGSMHIGDAGMCFLNDVIKHKPDYCFLDWFSTAYIPEKEELFEYLDTFRYRFGSNDCVIIFLLLFADPISNERLKMYDQVIEYSKINKLPYINVYDRPEINQRKNELLRDNVHTNVTGSKVYSKIIYNNFTSKILNQYNPQPGIKTRYSEVKSIEINSPIKQNIFIKGKGRLLGIYQKIGPYSGLIEIHHKETDIKKICTLWDRWCFYERDVVKIATDFDGELCINILNDNFDRSTAKEQTNWNVDKMILPYRMFYVGSINELKYT